MEKRTRNGLLIVAGLVVSLVSALWLTSVTREYLSHVVSYSVQADELVVSTELSTRYPSVHRYPEIVSYDDRDVSIQVYKLHGTVNLVNNQAETGHVGSCAWDMPARFTDAVEAAICGEVEYKLSKNNEDIRMLTFGNSKVDIEHFVKDALRHGAVMCSTMMSATESYRNRRLAFLGCVENDARSHLLLHSFMGLSFRSFNIKGLEYGYEYQKAIDEATKAQKEVTRQQQILIDVMEAQKAAAKLKGGKE